MNALAIDLGGSHATCAIVRDDSVLISSTVKVDGAGNLCSVLPALREELLRIAHASGVDVLSCEGLAFAFCGIVDARARRVLSTSKKFDDAVGLDLASWCRSSFGVPFAIENDARMALLGEVAFGAGKGACDAVMITLGSGIGGAALIEGKLLNSKHGQAGTLGGHMPVVLSGRLCGCGNRGCAETEASTHFLAEIYQAQANGAQGSLSGLSKLDFAQLFAAIAGGDAVAQATLNHCIHVWSVLAVALIHAYDPEVVIVGGAVAKRADNFLPSMQAYVKQYAWTPWGHVQLRPSHLGDQAALLGAIPLLKAVPLLRASPLLRGNR